MSRDVIVDTVSVQGVCSPEEKENGDFMDVISWEVLSVQEIIISLEPEPGLLVLQYSLRLRICWSSFPRTERRVTSRPALVAGSL
jgi:hypothetical protein